MTAMEVVSADVLKLALDQNDTMRQDLAHIGNLISDLARAMGVDQANADGSWPDIPGRICKLIAATARSYAEWMEDAESERSLILDWIAASNSDRFPTPPGAALTMSPTEVWQLALDDLSMWLVDDIKAGKHRALAPKES